MGLHVFFTITSDGKTLISLYLFILYCFEKAAFVVGSGLFNQYSPAPIFI
ncbi:hypothetical protein MARINOS108_11142 [Marinoscillum sp. 108]|nr:hypothetical protein MARINOS108_11142 [Marinoscillum sp. 108]